MKNLYHSVRFKVEAIGFWVIAAATITGALFYYKEPVFCTKSEEVSQICLPAVQSKDLYLSYYQQEQVIMTDLVLEVKAGSNRGGESLSRGERSYMDVIQGYASWYGGADGLDGLRTASGEIFDAEAYTAAHRTLSFGTQVKVTYLKTGRSVIVRINDRGPFNPRRIIDLSRSAAAEIGLLADGVGLVQLNILQ
ncbi:MAG: septal ring lytic transglycosylase RlpA family protein [Dethiobacter sp.]|jgi:rare lipoprotein A (peptidoglycan hydrolase)|nr:septal ring lytic transglycosylase RlpA family protein [Dethiobacter sp.]